MELRPEVRVNRFTLVSRLGKGGQGSVWKAIDPNRNYSMCALKIVQLGDIPLQAVERAYQEALILSKASHPSLVPCHEFWHESQSSMAGLLFDLIPGATLIDGMRDPRMSARHHLAIVAHLVSVLSHIHEKGVIHRDIKPGNIILSDNFWAKPTDPHNLKLVDFGIATDVLRPRGLTAPGVQVGTARYMAPEALLPELAAMLETKGNDYRRDVFAFGVLAWELLTGVHPTGVPLDQEAAFAPLYRSILNEKLPWPNAGNAGSYWHDLLVPCLSIHAAQRPPSAVDLARRVGMDPKGEAPRIPSVETSIPSSSPTTASHQPPTGARPSYPSMSSASPSANTAQQAQTNSVHPIPVTTSNPRIPSPSQPLPYRHDPPHPPPPPPSPSAPSRSFSWGLLGFGLFGGFALAVILFLIYGPWSAKRDDSENRRQAPPSPENPISPTTRNAPVTEVCCKDRPSCSSGRSCQKVACTELGERTWLLRIAGVALRDPSTGKLTGDMSGLYPGANVCMQVGGGSPVCAPMKNIASLGGDKINRLSVRTSDLETGTIRFWIEDSGNYVMPPLQADAKGKISNHALCVGLVLNPGGKASATQQISVYLDDF